MNHRIRNISLGIVAAIPLLLFGCTSYNDEDREHEYPATPSSGTGDEMGTPTSEPNRGDGTEYDEQDSERRTGVDSGSDSSTSRGAGGGSARNHRVDPADPAQQFSYVCPMHDQVRSRDEGTCSVCGMKLVLARTSATNEY